MTEGEESVYAWLNWYSHPGVEGEYHGNFHASEAAARAAADDELAIEPKARLLRTAKVCVINDGERATLDWLKKAEGGS